MGFRRNKLAEKPTVLEIYHRFIEENGCPPEEAPEKILVWCALLNERQCELSPNTHITGANPALHKYARRFTCTTTNTSSRRERGE